MKHGQIEQVAEICQGLEMIAGGCPPLLFDAVRIERRLLQGMQHINQADLHQVAQHIDNYKTQYEALNEMAQEYWAGASYED